MHHRMSKRKALEIEIDLYLQDKKLTGFRTRDISAEGMFVLSENWKLPKHTSLAVEIRPLGKRLCKPLRVPAIVSHSNDDGFGLMFHHHNHELLESLLDRRPSHSVA